MKYKTLYTSMVASAVILSVALPAFAQTSVDANLNVGTSVGGGSVNADTNIGANASSSRQARIEARQAAMAGKVQARIGQVTTHSDTAIDARITALNNLESRINAMAKVSASDKTSLSSTISGELSDMTTLKAKIDADGDSTTTLKADAGSITKSYRIFALIIPQGYVTAASDRVMTITSLMSTLSTKLQTRIATVQASGHDTTSLTASLNDLNAKSADANVQATAALSEVVHLTPDNGDATLLASNTAALKDAKAKIQVATGDLKAARNDAETIVKAIEALHINASASSTTSVQ